MQLGSYSLTDDLSFDRQRRSVQLGRALALHILLAAAACGIVELYLAERQTQHSVSAGRMLSDIKRAIRQDVVGTKETQRNSEIETDTRPDTVGQYHKAKKDADKALHLDKSNDSAKQARENALAHIRH